MFAYRGMQLSDGQHTVTLWYVSVPLEQLLADIDTIGRALRGTAGMCVFTDRQEAVTAVPALCAARGYICALVPYGSTELRQGDTRPFGRYRFYIGTLQVTVEALGLFMWIHSRCRYAPGPPEQSRRRFALLRRTPASQTETLHARVYLAGLFSDDAAYGAQLLVRAVGALANRDEIVTSCVLLAHDLLDATKSRQTQPKRDTFEATAAPAAKVGGFGDF